MKDAPSPQQRSDQGFTIVELLVALVILGIVMSMIPRTLALAGRAFRAAETIDARSSEAAAIDFITARLSQAMPVYRHANDGTLAIGFAGGERDVSFVAPLAAGKDATGLAVFTLKPASSGQDGSTAKGVALTWQIFRADVPPDRPQPPVHTREILPSSEGFALRYRGRKPRDETSPFGGEDADHASGPNLGEWQPQWTIRDVLPSEVEITYKSAGGRLHTRVVELKLATPR